MDSLAAGDWKPPEKIEQVYKLHVAVSFLHAEGIGPRRRETAMPYSSSPNPAEATPHSRR